MREKYRKAYYHIEKALKVDAYGVIILIGLRKTGKTKILQQLAENHNGHYIDFREEQSPEQAYLDVFDREEKLILLDEIGYLPGFDSYFGALEVDIKREGKKVVITSSSYGTLKQLSKERLGGGRSYTVELFPLDFEEYLYFSGHIKTYGEDYDPTAQDVQDFYRLKNLPEGMDFIIDKEYMESTFTDREVARANHNHAIRDIYLTKDQYIGIIDIIAYTLNDRVSLKRLNGGQIGAQEFGKDKKGISMSESLIGMASKIVANMMQGTIDSIQELACIIAYLYSNGFLFVDLTKNEDNKQIVDRVLIELLSVKTETDLKQVLKKYVFSVISPLIYTRLLVDLEEVANKLYTSHSLSGSLYELTIKSESVYKENYTIYHQSYRYRVPSPNEDSAFEVDLWDRGVLFEATITHKKTREHLVDKVMIDYPMIRVLTDVPGVWEDNGFFYRIGYPKALLMLSNGSIYNLKTRRISENQPTPSEIFDKPDNASFEKNIKLNMFDKKKDGQ